MKSCFGLLVLLLVFIGIIGGGGLIWYLSSSTEFTRAGTAPKATPVPGQVR